MSGADDEILKEFLVESYDNIDQLDRDLVELEKDPTNSDLLGAIFRCIHTIKGTCGFLGFTKLEKLTHAGENLLSAMRDGTLGLSEPIATGLLQMVDAVRTMLDIVQAEAHDGENDYAELVQRLHDLLEGGEAAPAESPEPTPQVATNTTPAPQEQETGNRSHNIAESNIRVDVAHLDKLMNLVGELVLARNQLLQYLSTQTDAVFLSTAQQLNLITTELQEGVMKTRMQPIKNVWGKFPRVVRDLAVACGKQVRIEMIGEETELDKTILEAIKDPLTHVVRNSVDHGVEDPDTRVAAGKPPVGTLQLKAYHEGGQVNIEIADDGGGIDVERVAEKAVERGLITPDQAKRMSRHEIQSLIFHPGFSTAQSVSNISGRGVGMDVVKTNIEKIGGAVDVQSRMGVGTTLKIKIPLTLAIIPALIVTSGGQSYALPQVSLIELVRLEGKNAQNALEDMRGTPVYRLRGKLLPLVYLNDQLGLNNGPDSDGTVNIIVLQADSRNFGLVVDQINDTEEIVVKPLSAQLKGIGPFAGATIMGDGKVALILDALGLAQKAGVVTERRGSTAPTTEFSEDDERGETRSVLLFGVGGDRMAIPLEMVARLEEFERDIIEATGDINVVQYRGDILPLIHLADVFGQMPSEHEGSLQVLVHRHDGNSVGLVVDEILDIVDDHIVIHRSKDGSRPGIEGTAVIQGKVTDLIDVGSVMSYSAVSGFEVGV